MLRRSSTPAITLTADTKLLKPSTYGFSTDAARILLDQIVQMLGRAPLRSLLRQRLRTNLRLSVWKLVSEAVRNGMLGEEAGNLPGSRTSRSGKPVSETGLTWEQAKELLAVPERSTLKGKRDYVILAVLGCALRGQELASLYIGTIQMREGR